MKKFTKIPHDQTGLFWYFENDKEQPEPVQLNAEKHPGKIKGFNGRMQSWLRDGEYLIGPQLPPEQ